MEHVAFIVASMIFILEAILHVLLPLSRLFVDTFVSSRFGSLTTEIALLIKEQSELNIVDDFAKHARLQRKINKLSDEQKEKTQSRKMNVLKASWIGKLVVYGTYTIAMVAILYQYRYTPMLKLPPTWFPYLNTVFAYPTNVPGAISLPCWIIICRQIARTVFS